MTADLKNTCFEEKSRNLSVLERKDLAKLKSVFKFLFSWRLK